MYIDKRLEFSDGQTVAANAASTNSIDLGDDNRQIGPGEPMYLVVIARSGSATNFQVQYQTDDDSGFASPTTRQSSETIGTFAAGDRIVMQVPFVNERHLRLNYVRTAGSVDVDAFLTNQHPPEHKAYPNAID